MTASAEIQILMNSHDLPLVSSLCFVLSALLGIIFKRKILCYSSNVYIADETEDEDVNKEYAEETNRDAVMIAAAKLVATDTVPKVKKHEIAIFYLVET